ncbi:hypothetical protein BC659_1150 [Sediminibacterium goheungense]|uniref:Phospholipase D-like protein n=1 Tax=Sediminibacterium goheungense TaxID=1086393 RepID=A0A4V3C5A2_9BACT|nr:hypothetical protein BC659_1150 [Sediminibacterium goheungense]
MDLFAPDLSLIAWSLLWTIHLILCVIAISKLATDTSIRFLLKLVFLIGIILIPFIGSLTFLRYQRKTILKKAEGGVVTNDQ